MTLAAWLERHTAAAPPALRERVGERVGKAALASAPASPIPAALAAAGQRALEAVVDHPGDRSVALDLLAADALITLALLAQAEEDPAALDGFATALIQAARPGT